jgi:diaminopimelate epimerase
MERMRFSKWHALGNSYLVVEQPDAGAVTPDRVRRLCDADTGVGSHGVVEVVAHSAAHAEIVIWNPDGSIAEMSGNGVRIAARWLAAPGGSEHVTIRTAGRELAATLGNGDDVELAVGRVEVGEPEWIDLESEGTAEITVASVGNPHAVIRRDNATREDLLRIGPRVEVHERFPDRTNVQLVEPIGLHDLRVLVWERGAGETPSSGSSSVAAAAVAIARGWCESPVAVRLPGGCLTVEAVDGTFVLTGPAELIASGETPL